jgi:PAS domain S-box-containing protein
VGRTVTDTSIAKVLAGPTPDFAPPPGVQHLSNGLLDQIPIAIAIFDCEGGLVRYNRSAADLWGRPPHLGDAISPLDRIAKDVLRTRAPLRGREIVFERPDGRRVFTSANADLVFGEDGNLVGVMICLADITAFTSKQQDDEQTAHRLFDALPLAVYTTDAEGRITYYNQAAADFWGRRPELYREQWCGSLKLFHPGGIPLPHEDSPMAVALKYGMALRGTEAIAERPDGTRIPFATLPTPLRDSEGRLTGAINVLIDISERKRGEERQRALISVLNHRVKNTLATVQALASQTIRGRGVKRDVRAKFVERLFALSRAHDLLTREGWDSADLLSVIEEVLAPYHGRIELHGKTIRISPKATVALSMVLHELAANATRYGALSIPAGRVTLAWATDAGKRGTNMILNWRESGGPPVVEPERRGFGLRLVERSIMQELSGNADIAFAPTGLLCILSFPVGGEDSAARHQQPSSAAAHARENLST